jgi:hypothetical protein
MNYFCDQHRLASLALLLLGMAVSTTGFTESALPPPLGDPALIALLHKQIEPEEGVDVQSIIKSDLEASLPGEEQVVIWTLLGPSYWSNHLSVVSQRNGQWQQLATLSLDGAEATLDTVSSDGLITVNAKTAGPNDPVCCPSQVKTLQYRYAKGQLIAASTGAKP